MSDRTGSTLAGRTLANRYDILDLIGAGGMGAVYRARDRELDELVALKVIRSDLANDDAIIERFRREVKLARRVTHANVARTFELGHADGVMFCTMELVEGESLTRRLRRPPRMPVAEAVSIACAVCDALAAAHAVDVIHRDIKPDNVLIARGGRIVLADFGIASVRVDGPGDLSGTCVPRATRGRDRRVCRRPRRTAVPERRQRLEDEPVRLDLPYDARHRLPPASGATTATPHSH